jgi:soluble lytic murein transglycosylase-like protein
MRHHRSGSVRAVRCVGAVMMLAGSLSGCGSLQPHQLATAPAAVSQGAVSSLHPAAVKAPPRAAPAPVKAARANPPPAAIKRPAAVVAVAAAAAPPPLHGEAYQVLPGATYASAATSMHAATSGDVVMNASPAPGTAAPQALNAMLQPVALRQSVPVSAEAARYIAPSASAPSAFGDAEAHAVRYAGGRCTEDIYNMAWSAADLFHIDPAFVAALIETESGCRNDAVSEAGARGLMQLIPHFGAREGYRFMHGSDRQPTLAELRDPATNIQLGVAYLGALQDHFYFVQSPAARLILVIAAYNCGPDFVDQRLPPQATGWNGDQAAQWVGRHTPAETRAFVVNVTEKAEFYSLVAANARSGSMGGKKNLSP